MGAQDFVDGLRALGCEVTEVASPPGAVANYITMPLTISAGRFAG